MIRSVVLSEDEVERYEMERDKLLLKDPWSDKLANKTGLVNMYIADTLAEVMKLRAEKNPDAELNCPNPDYKEYFETLTSLLNEKDLDKKVELFAELKKFVERYTKVTVTLLDWQNYTPDIRLLDTPEECLSWIWNYSELKKVSNAVAQATA